MTPTSALIGPNRAFELAFRDLNAINARLDVMHTEAWLPAGPNRDRPTPHRDPAAHPDHVKGSTWDCGLADEQARQGWQRMIWHLRNAEQVSTDVLCAAVGVESRSVAAYAPTGLLDAQSGVKRLASRLRALRGLHGLWSEGVAGGVTVGGVDVPRAQWLARELMGERGRPQGSCFDEVKQAMHEAEKIVRQVGTGKPPDVCSQCRSPRSVGQPRKGGLCYACDKRNQRNPLASARVRRTTVKAWRRAKAS